ncbi:unnamed protein product [Choristocarpus tenellus]
MQVETGEPGWKSGVECCAADTISFHYVGPSEARAMHAMLHDVNRFRNMDDEELLSYWPSSRAALGAYSVAPTIRDPAFSLLLWKVSLCEISSSP